MFWEAAYPRAYRALVERYGPAAGSPDLFLYAIMRKESGFDPDVVSYADARGLLQLIPAVGADVAAAAGAPFFADELYDVETNIRIGAAHIGGLVKAFGGQLLLAAGAYNGGSRPMQRWLAQHGRRPTDEFVELVTYEQTREYMKRVVGIYARYLYLYSGQVYALPLTVNAG
jgi:soluble lytic murein transglycosylase